MKKKLFATLLVVAIIATCICAFTACGGPDPNGPSELKAPKEWPTDITDGYGFTNDYLKPQTVLDKPSNKTDITFILDWAPNTNHTGLYVAQDKGYFAEENLNVTFIQPDLTGSSKMVAAGAGQFGIDFQEQMIFHEKNDLQVTAVAAIIQHNTSGLLRKKSAGIPTLDKMNGKQYATWEIPGEQVIVKHAINKAGGDYKNVTFVPKFITDIVSEFQNPKGADCVWSYAAWDNIKLDQAGIDYDFNLMQEYDERLDYYTPVIVGNNNFMEQNPAVAQAFLRAVKKGYDYCKTNPLDAVESLIKLNDGLDTDRDLLVDSALFLKNRYQGDAEYWGYIDAKRWDGFNDLMVELGKYDSTFTL